jgi:hypothetical protein
MKSKIIEYMIDHKFIQKNSMINATVQSVGLGGSPVILKKDILFEDSAKSPKGVLHIKGCDPENLRYYVVGAQKIHQINGMDEPTILRLFPEIKK